MSAPIRVSFGDSGIDSCPLLQHLKDLIERSRHRNRSKADKYWDIHREMEVELHDISMS
jgi:hypothetical protein